jgi:hypothetical protein
MVFFFAGDGWLKREGWTQQHCRKIGAMQEMDRCDEVSKENVDLLLRGARERRVRGGRCIRMQDIKLI